jgi:hypothetical protein
MEQKNVELRLNFSNTQEMKQIVKKKIKHLNASITRMPLLAFASKKEHLVLLDLYTHVHQDKFGGAKDSVFIKIANAEDLQFLL